MMSDISGYLNVQWQSLVQHHTPSSMYDSEDLIDYSWRKFIDRLPPAYNNTE